MMSFLRNFSLWVVFFTDSCTAVIVDDFRYKATPGLISTCCSLPAVNITAVLLEHDLFRQALDKVFPGAWFVEGGTLLGALRYGANVYRLGNGKVNWVDEDADFCVVIQERQRDKLIKAFMATLGKRFSLMATKSWGSVEIDGSYQFSKPLKHHGSTHSYHVSFMFEDVENGTLYPDPKQAQWVPTFPKGTKEANMTIRDLMFPRTKVKWAGGVGWATRYPLMWAVCESSMEYGHDGTWKKTWAPGGKGMTWRYCKCPVEEEDLHLVKESIEALHASGYGSFRDLLHLDEPTYQIEMIRQCANATPVRGNTDTSRSSASVSEAENLLATTLNDHFPPEVLGSSSGSWSI